MDDKTIGSLAFGEAAYFVTINLMEFLASSGRMRREDATGIIDHTLTQMASIASGTDNLVARRACKILQHSLEQIRAGGPDTKHRSSP